MITLIKKVLPLGIYFSLAYLVGYISLQKSEEKLERYSTKLEGCKKLNGFYDMEELTYRGATYKIRREAMRLRLRIEENCRKQI